MRHVSGARRTRPWPTISKEFHFDCSGLNGTDGRFRCWAPLGRSHDSARHNRVIPSPNAADSFPANGTDTLGPNRVARWDVCAFLTAFITVMTLIA